MTQTSWQETAIEMLTEVSILGSLINDRINEIAPAGLNEVQMAVLSVLGKSEGTGIALGALSWMLERGYPNIGSEIDDIISRGFAEQTDEMVKITEQGKAIFASALNNLFPSFEPALQGMRLEQMAQIVESLREIRRTLDHLPV